MDKTPNCLANFNERLKKNLETFLVSTCDIKLFEKDNLWISITKIKSKGEQLVLNKQKKQGFEIEFNCNYNLPKMFSLGQNVAYGNGVFTKVTNKPKYVQQEKNTKAVKRKRIKI